MVTLPEISVFSLAQFKASSSTTVCCRINPDKLRPDFLPNQSSALRLQFTYRIGVDSSSIGPARLQINQECRENLVENHRGVRIRN